MKKLLALILAVVMVISTMSITVLADEGENNGSQLVTADVASITSGNVTTGYKTIDDAIANWTNGTTLTLLDDVKVSDTIKLNSKETHILDLGEFTLTSKKSNAILIGDEGNAKVLTINSGDGGRIKATTAITNKANMLSDPKNASRAIIEINGGIFDGGINLADTKDPKMRPIMYINGGTFNGNLTTNRATVIISGGTFNGMTTSSVDTTSYMLIKGGRFSKKAILNNQGSELENAKLTFGTEKGVYDASIYVDEEGYFVVTSENINSDEFAAAYVFDFENLKLTPGGKTWHSSLYAGFYCSTIPTEYNNTLYFKNISDAISFNNYGTVVLFEDYDEDIALPNVTYEEKRPIILDLTSGAEYTGTIYLGRADNKLTVVTDINDNRTLNVAPYNEKMLDVEETEGTATLTKIYSSTDATEANVVVTTKDNKKYSYKLLQDAFNVANAGDTVTLLNDVTETVVVKGIEVSSDIDEDDYIVLDLAGKRITGNLTIEAGVSLIIKNGFFKTTADKLFEVEEGGKLVIKSGEFSHDPSKYTADDVDSVYRGEGEYPYIVINEKKASQINVELVGVKESLYNIVLKSADNYDIYEFVSAELTFEDHSTTVGGEDMQYEILGIEGKTTAQRADGKDKENQFIISIPNADDRTHRLSTDMSNNINEIVIGQVKFIGQGTLDFKVTGGKVVATWQGTDLGRYYENASLNLAGAAVNSSVAEKKRDVTINVAYNHALDGEYWDDNEITVSIKDGFGNTDKYGVKDLTNGTATFPDVQLGRLTVTLEAPGFRKYVYYTTLEEGDSALVLNFWNNVKRNEAVGGVVIDPEEKIEAGKDETYAHNFLVGDIVMDYTVDEYDLAAVTSYYGTYKIDRADADKYIKYDLNRDGNIDIIDVHYVLHTLNN